MKIVSGMQGTRNQEISSENKDEKKKTTKREDIPTKRRQEERGRNKEKTRGKGSRTAPVKHLGKWF